MQLKGCGRTKKEDSHDTLAFPSPQEYKVLRLVGEGKRNKEIAIELGIHIVTVKRHIRILFLKLRAIDRIELVAKAIKQGLIEPET